MNLLENEVVIQEMIIIRRHIHRVILHDQTMLTITGGECPGVPTHRLPTYSGEICRIVGDVTRRAPSTSEYRGQQSDALLWCLDNFPF